MRLTAADARARYARARISRLATVSAAGAPHLVPVTTAVVGDRIVFAVDHKPKSTLALQRLTNIAAEPRVCFLADGYDEDWSRLWWVRADAHAQVLADGDEGEQALDALAAKYPQYEKVRPAGPVVSARVSSWSGWAASALR